MAFVNEFISKEDRELHRLEVFNKRFPLANPQDTWAIDRERNIFLRTIKPSARKTEPGDPDARFEIDFHYRWKGYDYLVATRRLDAQELQEWAGEIFESGHQHDPDIYVMRFYLRHIGEMYKPSPDAPSALLQHRHEVLSDLEDVLAFGYGGAFARVTPEEAARARYAVFKIAPHAEVV